MISTDIRDRLALNLERIEEQIQRACERCGCLRDSVCLIAVTKYVDTGVMEALASLGTVEISRASMRPTSDWTDATTDSSSVVYVGRDGGVERNSEGAA